jgi:hypothetical protein
MSTREPELTAPVDLCAPDGRRLNPAAKGWSRRPLHRANLRGVWGRTKRWDYWAIQSEDLIVAVTMADIDYLGLVTIDWIEPHSHRSGGRSAIAPLGRGIDLPELACSGGLTHRSRHLALDIAYADDATTITATWTERDGRAGSVDVVVAQPEGHESLNVVIPWSDTRFQFTSKHQGRPAVGTVTYDGRTVSLGGDGRRGEGGAPAWGVLDVGRGRWPYRTTWNWGGGAGTSTDGAAIGLQLGAKWTDGTGFTENGVFVDGRLHKIGDELEWDYDWDRPMSPWRVRSADGSLDVTLEPVHDRHAPIDLLVLKTEAHQVFGRWTGVVTDERGDRHQVEDILGFVEESRSRW